ncbi:MAG: aminoacyl-tRNA hydrolase [Clostridia bacterium]|nr:aminoacyl-tRNA hydrolase [Clostridia bacterium]
MFVILGIGNPGKKYDGTRHNIGFIAMDYMAEKYGIKINKIKHKALVGEGTIAGEKVLLVKPQTYVNLSGESLREICAYYKVPPKDVIVIHDDVSLPCGKLRIRAKGSDGGHNGLKSIIYQLSSDEFTRIKIGVGAPPEHYDMADWVLGHFSKEEVSHLSKLVDCVVEEIVPEIIQNGVPSAMNNYNGKAF